MTEKIDKEKLEKRAKWLYALFWVLVILSSMCTNFYIAWYEVHYGIDLVEVPGLFHLSCGIVMGLVFVPMLMQTRKWAKAAGADRLYAKATKWYRIFAICVVATVILNILGWLFPSLFS